MFNQLRLTPVQWLAAIGAVAAAILFFLPVTPLDAQTSRVAGLVVLLVVLWATNAIPPFVAVLVFFAVATVFGVVPPALVFSGFASGAFWLVFGGLVIGAAVKQTGLASRLANRMAARFGRSYTSIIGGVILLGVGLSFIIPSGMGRVVILVPVAVALADSYQFGPTDRGRYGLILAMVYGAHLPSFSIMPASVPNMLLVGTIESVWGEVVQYGSYLLLHFPVLGLLKAVVMYGLIMVLFRDELPAAPSMATPDAKPLSAAEWRLAVILAVVLVLWALDFVHGIAPSWVALAAAVLLLLPGVGVLSQDDFNRGIRYSTLIFVAGVIALGAVIADSALSGIIAAQAERWLPLAPGQPVVNYFALTFTATGLALVATIATVPAVMVPLAGALAEASGLPLMSVLMLQVVGFSTVFFPYQAPPLLVGIALGDVPIGQAVRFTVALAAVTIVLLLPLNLGWWLLLGQL